MPQGRRMNSGDAIDVGSVVRLASDVSTVPPLLRGLYGEVVLADEELDGIPSDRVKVWNWNIECHAWIPHVRLEPLPADRVARLLYVFQKDGDLPTWREAIDRVHHAWQNWERLMKELDCRRPDLAWSAMSWKQALSGLRPSYFQRRRAQRLWDDLLSASERLAQTAQAWLEE